MASRNSDFFNRFTRFFFDKRLAGESSDQYVLLIRSSSSLFKLRCSLFRDLCIISQTEEHIDIRFDGVDLLCLFLEPCPFIIEPFLLFCEPFLLGLERLQARQFSISLYRKKVALCCLKDDQFRLVFCTERGLVLCLLEGFIYLPEALVVADVFDERLHFTKTGFNTFRLIASAGIGAVDVLNLCLKISIL